MISFLDNVQFKPVANGTVDFVVDVAVAGYRTPQTALAANNETYGYCAKSEDGSQFEIGVGSWSNSSNTFVRTTITSSTTGSKINFTAIPVVGFVQLSTQIKNPIVDTIHIGASGGLITSMSSNTINSATDYFDRTISAATTFVFSNPSVNSGYAYAFVLRLINGGSQTITWPASVLWPSDLPPTLIASGIDILTFVTYDLGTTWYGALSMTDLR